MIDTYVSIHNVLERAVFDAIANTAPQFPGLAGREDLLADIACIALNRLMPRYVVHEVDLAFYATDRERVDQQRKVADAVRYAFAFLTARTTTGERA